VKSNLTEYRRNAVNTKSIVKQVVTVLGTSVVLATGVAHAADSAASIDQLTDGSSQVVAATTIKSAAVAATSNRASATTEKVRERVDINSSSYRKFLDDIAQRSGG
jgi:hypothetical protein